MYVRQPAIGRLSELIINILYRVFYKFFCFSRGDSKGTSKLRKDSKEIRVKRGIQKVHRGLLKGISELGSSGDW